MSNTHTPKSKHEELVERTAERFIKLIEEGLANGDWRKPWTDLFGSAHYQAQSERAYTGMNQLILAIEAFENGFEDQRWATYKTWASLGAQVRKGSKGTKLTWWKSLFVCKSCTKKSWTSKPCTIHGESNKRLVASTFTVFNADQVDGAPELPARPEAKFVPADRVMQLIDALPLTMISADPNRAFFSNSRPDVINIPPVESFDSQEGWASTVLHEVTHWSGHSSRLDRTFGKVFGDAAYSHEELIAEIGGASLGQALGIHTQPPAESAQYVASWLSSLRADPSRLYDAARDAHKAVTFLLGHLPQEAQVAA